MMDLLNKFKKVVEIKNITQAAKELNITQPALTISLNRLEEELGKKLLIRSKRGVFLTDEGKIAYEYANKFNLEYKTLVKKLSNANSKKNKKIKFGMIDSIGANLVSKIFSESFNSSQIKFNLVINNSRNLVELLLKAEIDFAIITKPEERISKQITLENLGEEKFVLVSNKEISKQIKTKKDLSKFSFVSYNPESNTHKSIKHFFDNKNIDLNFDFYSSSPEFSLEMIKNGYGIGMLPETSVKELIKNKNLFKINLNLDFKRQLVLINLHENYLDQYTTDFIEKLKKLFK